jgi:glucosyl-dolichyl phosphate glucuronosyltransferase
MEPQAPNNTLEATIIICAYTAERWDDLRAAIEPLRVQTRRPKETILVIDHNEDLLQRAREAFPDVKVVANTNGRGASGGRNTGYELSTGDVLVFLDDDTIAESTWLENLLRPLKDEAVLGTGGDLQPLWQSAKPTWFTSEFNWVVGCSHTGMPTVESPIRNPICANMSVRKQVFERAGGFEQALSRLDNGGVVTGTAEETEFCIRALRASPGSSWVLAPDARVLHIVPSSRTSWAFYRQRCRLEGASKAILTELAGTQDGLSSERAYVTSVLPRAVFRELRAAIRGDRHGLSRAVSIIAGVGFTATAYACVRLDMAVGRRQRPTPSTSATYPNRGS